MFQVFGSKAICSHPPTASGGEMQKGSHSNPVKMENVASKKCLQEEAGSCYYHSKELEGSEATKSL
jgi:hypothetical protein